MSRKAKIWLIASAIVLVFVIVVWFVGAALHLASPDIWVFRAGLWVLGAVAAGFVVWYLLRQLAPQTAPGTRTDDIDAAMNAARAQLAAEQDERGRRQAAASKPGGRRRGRPSRAGPAGRGGLRRNGAGGRTRRPAIRATTGARPPPAGRRRPPRG